MARWSRLFSLAISLASIATYARAVEVRLQLVSATYAECNDDQANGTTCGPPLTATLLPAVPDGPGSRIDIDAAGVVIRAVLQLHEFGLDGTPVTQWTGTLEKTPGGYTVADPNHTRPFLLPDYGLGFWWPTLTRVTNQSDFAGELALFADRNVWGDHRHWQLTFAFSSLPTDGPPPCAGDVLLLDDDGDGEANGRDARPWALDETFGPGVDENGLSIADFCGDVGGRDSRTCRILDFRNDEPARRKPRDCKMVRPFSRARYCGAAEYFGPVAPASPPRACQGYTLFDDADVDGEPDSTDRCASTPIGSAIDGNGCSAEQFCSQQSMQLCRRADFGNDEPFARNPGDCVATRSTPRACAAATTP
jgi:hypothetical protein